jgi:zinc protease
VTARHAAARPGSLSITRFARAGLLAAGLLASTILAAAPLPAAARVFDPETFTLSNGMQVVVVTNRRAPVVSHMVWYKVGAADDPAGRSGIAHYLEHLMFKGTKEIPPAAYSRIIARNGGRDNAFTAWDYTAYFQNIARDRLELVMKMEADRMQNLRLEEQLALPERSVIMEERRQRTDDNPGARLSEQLAATLWVHHPYGTPIIGWMHEIEQLTYKDALEFYRTWYVPNNAILVVCGDVTAAELKPLAEKYYGSIPTRPVPPRHRLVEPPLQAERRVVLRDSEVRQPSVERVWKAPSYSAGDKQYAYSLQVLASIMGDGATSRLYRSLVVEQGLATGANMSYSPDGLDGSEISVSATPAPDVPLEKVEAALKAEVATLLKDGVTDAEVAVAKKKMQANAVFARDSLQGPAYAFGLALTTGQTVDDVEAWPDRIGKVTSTEVTAAARAVLGKPDVVVGVLLPDPNAPARAPRPPAGPGAGGAIR